MTDCQWQMQVFSVHKTKLSFKNSCIDTTQSSLTCSSSSCSTENTSQPVCWCQAHTGTSLPALPTSGTPPSWLSPESSCQLPSAHLMMVWLCLEDWKGKVREKAIVEVKCWNVYSVWCQNDSDLDFSTSSEYRASTKPSSRLCTIIQLASTSTKENSHKRLWHWRLES